VLYKEGAEGKAYFSITHPILLPSAIKLLDQNPNIEKLVVTNTVPIHPRNLHPKIEIISIAPLLAEIIDRIYKGDSISNKLIPT
jgi:ribose-phosphate pyrophosphokinase